MPGANAAGGGGLQAPVAPMAGGGGHYVLISSAPARGAKCEVRMDDSGLRGGYFNASVLSPARADGLVQVQYTLLYESVHKDGLLTEWIRPKDFDVVRPPPPDPPDGWHATLEAGDLIDVWHEQAWWPAAVVAPRGAHAFEVGSDDYPALRRTVGHVKMRPRWRWMGNAWQMKSVDKENKQA